MKKLKDIESLRMHLQLYEPERAKIVEALEDYFGKDDTLLILNTILYFKYPQKHYYLKDPILEYLNQEL